MKPPRIEVSFNPASGTHEYFLWRDLDFLGGLMSACSLDNPLKGNRELALKWSTHYGIPLPTPTNFMDQQTIPIPLETLWKWHDMAEEVRDLCEKDSLAQERAEQLRAEVDMFVLRNTEVRDVPKGTHE